MKHLILFATIITLSATTATAQFAGGSGTENDPYQVETVEQLQEIRNNTDKHFVHLNIYDKPSIFHS